MPNIDFLSLCFAFLLGSLVGYIAGSPVDHQHTTPSYSAPLEDTLPTMGQE